MLRTGTCLSVCVLTLSACGELARSQGKTCTGELYTQQSVKLAGRTESMIGQQIKLCKGGATPKVVNARMPDYPIRSDSVLQLNMLYEVNRKGEIRYDGSCNDNGRKVSVSEYVPVALTSESFSVFRLCYFDGSRTKISLSLLSENQDCPQGSKAQDHPVDDCTKID